MALALKRVLEEVRPFKAAMPPSGVEASPESSNSIAFNGISRELPLFV